MLSRKKLKKVGRNLLSSLLIDQFTLENQHRTQTCCIGRLFSFLLGWLFGFMLIFQGVSGAIPLGFHVHFGSGLCRIIHLLYNAVRIRIAISSIAVNSNLHLKWSPGLVFNTQTDWKQARIYISIWIFTQIDWGLGESLKYGDGDFNHPLLPITYLAWGFQVPTGCRCLYVTLETRCVRIIWTIPAFHWSWTNGTLGAA